MSILLMLNASPISIAVNLAMIGEFVGSKEPVIKARFFDWIFCTKRVYATTSKIN